MPRLILPMLVLVVSGCPKKTEVEPSITADLLSAPPQLPSPTAGSYARVVKPPKDPVVRAVVGRQTWDESLAGAAAGLALAASGEERGGFTRREIREAAWQAGYPWPVLSLGTWPTSEAGSPPAGVAAWVAEQPAGRDVGLVRARGGGRDLWVGLAGKPLIDLGIVPREVASGESLGLPARPGARWRTSDGAGVLREGTLDQAHTVEFDVPGEWVVQVVDDGGDLARFTVYVDEQAAPDPVLPPRNIAVTDKAAATERLRYLVQRARNEYRAPDLLLDPLLDQAAADAMQKAVDPKKYAISLGPGPERSIGARCVASSVEDCVDQWLWDPRTRRAFVESRPWAGGFAMKWTPDRVEIWAILVGS